MKVEVLYFRDMRTHFFSFQEKNSTFVLLESADSVKMGPKTIKNKKSQFSKRKPYFIVFFPETTDTQLSNEVSHAILRNSDRAKQFMFSFMPKRCTSLRVCGTTGEWRFY